MTAYDFIKAVGCQSIVPIAYANENSGRWPSRVHSVSEPMSLYTELWTRSLSGVAVNTLELS